MAERRRRGNGGGRTAVAMVLIFLGILLAAGLTAGGVVLYRIHKLPEQAAQPAPPEPALRGPIETLRYEQEDALEVGVVYRADRALRLLRGGNPAELSPEELGEIARMPGRFVTTVSSGVFRVARNERSPHDGTWWMLLQIKADSLEEDVDQVAVERWVDSTQLIGARLEIVERPGGR